MVSIALKKDVVPRISVGALWDEVLGTVGYPTIPWGLHFTPSLPPSPPVLAGEAGASAEELRPPGHPGKPGSPPGPSTGEGGSPRPVQCHGREALQRRDGPLNGFLVQYGAFCTKGEHHTEEARKTTPHQLSHNSIIQPPQKTLIYHIHV